ncbi:TPA: DUF2804 domain-containing protein [Pseudomonas aeruginosa]|nr:DUF2804 domain-containing protein [Pseudomonas aeruginosa]
MQRLIQANGQPHYGIFPSAPQHINYRDFDFRSPMGRRVGALGKWRRFHQFQYFGLISPELIGGCALAQLSLLGVGFVYLYQPSSGRMLERRFKLPLGFGTRFSQTPDDGVCELRQGRNLLRLENRMAHREKLQALDAFAHHDWSAGYMRPETFWNWACLSGEADGLRVGLNLSCGVNETSFTENCYWLDGELLKVDSVRFDFDRDQPLRPWTIRSYDGQVELRFEAHGMHQERLNLGLLASNFKQIFGCFSGVLRPRGRAEVRIERLWGFVEDQYAKW